ncbi:HET domain-containing protein [Microdochium nivale]|nr:HET domain-containing protein [Microdochium nivale]
MTTCQYWPLDAEQRMIRLAAIQPGSFDNEITVSLYSVRLDAYPLPEGGGTSDALGPYPKRHPEQGDELPSDSTSTIDAIPLAPGLESSSAQRNRLTRPQPSFAGYECLSYTWGSEEDPLPVYVNSPPASEAGDMVIKVTQNLEQALRHLRHTAKERVFFIDAICIDQSNTSERGEQVAVIGEIYQRAAGTVIWLGPEADDSDYAMKVLEDVASTFKVHLVS